MRHNQHVLQRLDRVKVQPPPRWPASNRPSLPCGGPGCETCPIVLTTDSITSRSMGNTHRIHTAVSCQSSNVIICMLEMRAAVCRHSGTSSTWMDQWPQIRWQKRKSRKPVPAHFSLPDHSFSEHDSHYYQKAKSKQCSTMEATWKPLN